MSKQGLSTTLLFPKSWIFGKEGMLHDGVLKLAESCVAYLIVHSLVLGHLLTILAQGAPAGALTPLAVVVGVDTCDRVRVMHML